MVQFPQQVTLEAQVTEETDETGGNLENANVMFDIFRIECGSADIHEGTYIIQADTTGLATTTIPLDVGEYTIICSIFEQGYYIAPQVSTLVAVYNPSEGKTKGYGWIEVNDPSQGNIGRTDFHFDITYVNDIPAGYFNLFYSNEGILIHTTDFTWLVRNDTTASFLGTGVLWGVPGDYTVLVNLKDGAVTGEEDMITIKIWEGDNTNAEPLYKAINQQPVEGYLIVQPGL